MQYINFPSAKLTPLQLDTQASNNKTLAGLLKALQIGSTLKGVVSEISNSGHAIFTTTYGKFTVTSESNLRKGDLATIRISQLDSDQQQLAGAVILVNNKSTENKEEIKLELISLPGKTTSNTEATRLSTAIVTIQKPSIAPNTTVAVTVNYINRDNLKQNSPMHKIAEKLEIGTAMECEIVYNNSPKLSTHYQMTGEVISNDQRLGYTLLKTDFGILTVKSMPVHCAIGKKLNLEIKTIDGINTNIENASSKALAAQFLFTLDKALSGDAHEDIPRFTQIMQNMTIDLLGPDHAISHYVATKNQYELILDQSSNKRNKPITSSNGHETHKNNHTSQAVYSAALSDHKDQDSKILPETILSATNLMEELSSTIEKIKSGFTNYIARCEPNESQSQWMIMYLPVNNNEHTNKPKIFLKRSSSKTTRFVVLINTKYIGELQLDGTVTIAANDKDEIKNFALIIRAKKTSIPLHTELYNGIKQIFTLYSAASDIKSDIAFKTVKELKLPD